MRSAIWLVLLAACSSSKGGASVELSSVTLADDCEGGGYRQPPPKPTDKPDSKVAASQEPARAETEAKQDASAPRQASCPKGAPCNFNRRGCTQTSMQLSIKTDEAATVHVVKVELLDDSGKILTELAWTDPAKWVPSASGYARWDETLDAKSTTQVSYALAAPAWSSMSDRSDARSKQYQLRVALEIGGASHTVEKQSIAPALMEPEVMTLRYFAHRALCRSAVAVSNTGQVTYSVCGV